MRTSLALVAASLVLCAAPASASTWDFVEVIDPVSKAPIEVKQYRSWGSYMYSAYGKEDHVNWPMTDSSWLWFNPKSGYGAFADHFLKLQGTDLAHVRKWLAANYDKAKPPVTRIEQLQWLARVYAERRDVDEIFWCYFYRLLAFETAKEDAAASVDYVRKALPLLERQLGITQDEEQRVATLYLLGEYHRRLGDLDVSRGYFDQVRSTPDTAATRRAVRYFTTLIEEREALNAPPPGAATPEQ